MNRLSGRAHFFATDVVRARALDGDGGLRRDGGQEFQIVSGEDGRRVEAVGVDRPVDARLREQRGAKGRAHARGEDRIRLRELSIGGRVLREEGDPLAESLVGSSADRDLLRAGGICSAGLIRRGGGSRSRS